LDGSSPGQIQHGIASGFCGGLRGKYALLVYAIKELKEIGRVWFPACDGQDYN
jgi:hypothetical protein